jgi:hypothetical protein
MMFRALQLWIVLVSSAKAAVKTHARIVDARKDKKKFGLLFIFVRTSDLIPKQFVDASMSSALKPSLTGGRLPAFGTVNLSSLACFGEFGNSLIYLTGFSGVNK